MTPEEKLAIEEYKRAVAEAEICNQETLKITEENQEMILEIEEFSDSISPEELDRLFPLEKPPITITTKLRNLIKWILPNRS